MDQNCLRGRGGPSRKLTENSGAGGSTVKPPGMENHWAESQSVSKSHSVYIIRSSTARLG